MKTANSFEKLTERLKDSTQEAKVRHAEFGQPVVYKERNGDAVYEYLNGTKKVVKPVKVQE